MNKPLLRLFIPEIRNRLGIHNLAKDHIFQVVNEVVDLHEMDVAFLVDGTAALVQFLSCCDRYLVDLGAH